MLDELPGLSWSGEQGYQQINVELNTNVHGAHDTEQYTKKLEE